MHSKDNSLSHLGSYGGKQFLAEQNDIKSQFLGYFQNGKLLVHLFFFFFFFSKDYFSSYEMDQPVGGAKTLTHPQEELGSSQMWPERGSNPHQTQR